MTRRNSLPWNKAFPKEIISLQSLRQLTSVTTNRIEHLGMKNWSWVSGGKAMLLSQDPSWALSLCFSRLLVSN